MRVQDPQLWHHMLIVNLNFSDICIEMHGTAIPGPKMYQLSFPYFTLFAFSNSFSVISQWILQGYSSNVLKNEHSPETHFPGQSCFYPIS